MYEPMNKARYRKRAREVLATFIETGGDFEKTAKEHFFRSTRSVYRYLNYAGYKFSPQPRGKDGRFIPKTLKNYQEEIINERRNP